MSDRRVIELENIIQKANAAYWTSNEPIMTDTEYDGLMKELRTLVPDHPLLAAIGSHVTSGQKVKHDKPMLSLDKAYSVEEVVKWANKLGLPGDSLISATMKFDGTSCCIKPDGTLATRGDGETGENITDKARFISLKGMDDVARKAKTEIRGELIVTNQTWTLIKDVVTRKGGEKYKNSRNIIPGVLCAKDTSVVYDQLVKTGLPCRFITFMLYDFMYQKVAIKDLTPEKAQVMINELTKLSASAGFPIDGIVFKVLEKDQFERLGNTSHHPRGAIAYKLANQSATTKLNDITWAVGKTGAITPVAELEPVELSGVTVSRATLHNWKNVVDMDIQINDILTIERAGDVIPYVVSRDKGENRHSQTPLYCPSCGANVKVNESGVELMCTDKDNCPEVMFRKVHSALLKYGVDEIGLTTIVKLRQIYEFNDVYEFYVNFNIPKVAETEGFGAASADKFSDELHKLCTSDTWKPLAALNIEGVGRRASTTIMKVLTPQEILETDLQETLKAKLMGIDSIGPKLADAISSELCLNCKSRTLFKNLVALLEQTDPEQGEEKMDKKTICFTGKMTEPRSKMEELARSKGYQPESRVTKDLDVLVCADPNSGSSKMQKARKHGTKIISEQEFRDE